MPNPMTGAGYGDKKPKPSPKPMTPEQRKARDMVDRKKVKPMTPEQRKARDMVNRKKVKLGNVTTLKGSLYEKRQLAFLKKMQEMNKQSMKPKYNESQLPPRRG